MTKFRVLAQEIQGDRDLWLTIPSKDIFDAKIEADLVLGGEYRIIHIGEVYE